MTPWCSPAPGWRHSSAGPLRQRGNPSLPALRAAPSEAPAAALFLRGMPENSASYPGRPAPAADRPGARSPMQAPTAQAEVPHISPRGHGPERHACSARPCPGGRPSRQPYYLTSSIKQQVSFRPAMGEPAARGLKPLPAGQAPRSADPPGRAHGQPAQTGLFLHARRDDFVRGQMEELVQRPARSSLRSTQAAPSP